MQKLLCLADGIDRLIEGIGRLTGWLVVVMLGIGVGNVVGRYGGKLLGQNLASNGLLEAQWYLFDLVFLLGAAYALKQNEHVRVDIFYKNLGPKGRAWVNLLGTLLLLIPFCLLVLYYSWASVINSWQIWEMSPDPGGLPRYPIKTMMLVSFGLLILQGLAEMIKSWAILLDLRSLPEEHHDPNL